MNIPFRRITKTPREFDLSSGNVKLEGTLVFKARDLIMMKAQLSGSVTLPCDICAEPFDLPLDEELELLISDGIYNGSDEDLDVVEMQESINMDELLHSEIELIKSDYHSCEQCKNQERI